MYESVVKSRDNQIDTISQKGKKHRLYGTSCIPIHRTVVSAELNKMNPVPYSPGFISVSNRAWLLKSRDSIGLVYVVVSVLIPRIRPRCTWQFLKRILQTQSSSVKKHTGTGIDTKCSHNSRRCRISFLNLSGRQSNSVEPERFITDF